MTRGGRARTQDALILDLWVDDDAPPLDATEFRPPEHESRPAPAPTRRTVPAMVAGAAGVVLGLLAGVGAMAATFPDEPFPAEARAPDDVGSQSGIEQLIVRLDGAWVAFERVHGSRAASAHESPPHGCPPPRYWFQTSGSDVVCRKLSPANSAPVGPLEHTAR